MNYGRHGWSYLFIRFGVGITFLWIGVDMFRHPDAWIWFIPATLPFNFDRNTFLSLTAILDTGLGTLFLINMFPKLVAVIAAIHLLGIIIVHGIDVVVIRDVGLLGACLALIAWPSHYHKHHS